MEPTRAPPPRIETGRLVLRPHVPDDYPAMCALFSDPDVLRHISRQTLSAEDVWNRLLRYIGHWTLLGHGLFAIVERDSGQYIGETGFADFHRGLGTRFDAAPEAAWLLASRVHGTGIATEATNAAHAWFDASSIARRSVCIISPDNLPSQRVATRLGYVPFAEAVHHDHPVIMYERDVPAH